MIWRKQNNIPYYQVYSAFLRLLYPKVHNGSSALQMLISPFTDVKRTQHILAFAPNSTPSNQYESDTEMKAGPKLVETRRKVGGERVDHTYITGRRSAC